MVHLQGALTLSWVLLAIVLVSSVPQSALVKCWTFERWDLVGGPWITGGENHETPGFFFLFCSFVSWPQQAILLFSTSTVFVLHYPKLKGKEKLRSGTSGSTSSNNPSLFINCLCRVFC